METHTAGKAEESNQTWQQTTWQQKTWQQKTWQQKEQLDDSSSRLSGKEDRFSDTEGEDSLRSSKVDSLRSSKVATKPDEHLEEPTEAALRAWSLFSFADVRPTSSGAEDAASRSADVEVEAEAAAVKGADAYTCAAHAVTSKTVTPPGKASPPVRVTSYGNSSSPTRRGGGGKGASAEVHL